LVVDGSGFADLACRARRWTGRTVNADVKTKPIAKDKSNNHQFT
jgi:hypothetical protein